MRKGARELALAKALRAHPPQDGDGPIVALARDYARAMDAGAHIMEVIGLALDDPELEPLVKLLERLDGATTLQALGTGYRQALVELGLTPKARAALMKGQPTPATAKGSALDELRAQRERRGTA